MLASAGGYLLGGLGSSVFDLLSNLTLSLTASKRSYKYQSKLQQQQFAFIREMANTAHQREVADLKAAGLNPILTATGGSGASIGNPSSGGQVQVTTPESDLFQAVGSALQAEQLGVNARLADASVKQADTSAKLADAQVQTEVSKQRQLDAQRDLQRQEARLAAEKVRDMQSGLSSNSVNTGVKTFKKFLDNVPGYINSATKHFDQFQIRNSPVYPAHPVESKTPPVKLRDGEDWRYNPETKTFRRYK